MPFSAPRCVSTLRIAQVLSAGRVADERSDAADRSGTSSATTTRRGRTKLQSTTARAGRTRRRGQSRQARDGTAGLPSLCPQQVSTSVHNKCHQQCLFFSAFCGAAGAGGHALGLGGVRSVLLVAPQTARRSACRLPPPCGHLGGSFAIGTLTVRVCKTFACREDISSPFPEIGNQGLTRLSFAKVPARASPFCASPQLWTSLAHGPFALLCCELSELCRRCCPVRPSFSRTPRLPLTSAARRHSGLQ